MPNKSYRIGYHFQQRVVKHLKEHNFNCIVQPKSAFPDIVAWTPFISIDGKALFVNAQQNLNGEVSNKVLIPYYVVLVECKVNKYLSKKEKEAAKKILKERRCNTFLVAYREKRKLKFQEIEIKDNITIAKDIKKPIPFYLR